MKKIIALLLIAVLSLSLVACGEEKVSDIEVNGETVAVTDFLIEYLQEYISTEEFANREEEFAANFGTPETPFTVTRVIELKADGLGESNMSIHYLLVKADWWYCTDDGDVNDNILIIVNYDTGEVLDQFMADESWLEDTESLDYWNYSMLNGCLVGTGYDGGVIVIDSETRIELSDKEIQAINTELGKQPSNDEELNQNADSEPQSDESNSQQGDESQTEGSTEEDEATETIVELTLDNWAEYFEIRPSANGALYNSFNEFERLDYVSWDIFLKDDVADKVTEMNDVAIEYSFRDGYFSWFEYNLDTGEFVKKNAAAEGEVDSWLKVEDSNRDLPLSLSGVKEDGCFLVFINKHLSESLHDNIYSFIGEAYGTMEITRIKGTLTVIE